MSVDLRRSASHVDTVVPGGVHRISCERCRKRKIRCNRQEPCTRCIKAGEDCSFRGNGERQRPIPRRQVQVLDDRLASLENFIQELAGADDASRRRLLTSQDLVFVEPRHQRPQGAYAEDPVESAPVLSSPARSEHVSTPSGEVAPVRTCEGHMRKLTARNAAQFFGGTSLFQLQVPERTHASRNRQISSPGSVAIQTMPEDDSSNVTNFPYHPYDPICQQLMASVFQHLYEYNHCIYREYFLRDYDARGGPYYSEALMYSICAVGALTSRDESMRALCPIFLKHAQTLVLRSLDVPDLTILQSLVLLGQLEIGQGRGSKGWLFCGMACRLTHEMGLHLDPSHWNGRAASAIDREILRRVYWAVFCTDKQLSLYFGRPPALYPHEADVRNTMRIPYPPEWQNLLETYLRPGVAATAFEDGLGLVSSFVHQVELAKLFHTMIVEVFENRRGRDDGRASEAAQRVHASMEKWLTSLPQKLRWYQCSTGRVAHYVLHLHMLFHTGMIILHRPTRLRLDDEDLAGSDDVEVCYESMAAILRLVKSYGKYYRYQELPLDFVHTLSATAGVVLLKRHVEKLPWTDTAVSRPLELILSTMEAIQDVWPCILEIKEGVLEAMSPDLSDAMQQEYELDPELMSLLESGASSLPNPWSTFPYGTPPDVAFGNGNESLDIRQDWGIS